MKNLVSIIVPVHNAALHLDETLNCIKTQTYSNIEVILVDDGSTDTSREICKRYAHADKRFNYVYQENAGAGAARNCGLGLAKGDFLMFLDSDDLFENNLVEKLIWALEKNNSDVAVCFEDGFVGEYSEDSAFAIETGRCKLLGNYQPVSLGRNFFQCVTASPWDKMFRSSFIYENKLKFQTLRFSNDAYFVFSALLLARQITWIDNILVHYRMGQGTNLRDKMYLSPVCDLEMLDALRKTFSNLHSNNRSDLKASLEDFSSNLVFSSYSTLVFQSAQAAEVFRTSLIADYLPQWLSLDDSRLVTGEFKSKVKMWLVTHFPLENFIWAMKPFERDPIRFENRHDKNRYFLRLAVSPLFALLFRIKS